MFNESIDLFYDQKNANLYLMKIQTNFVTKKIQIYI